MAQVAAIDDSHLEGGLYGYSGNQVIASSVVFIVCCTLAIALRFFTLLWITKCRLGIEDWLMLPAWILMIGFSANAIISVKIGGVGQHQFYLSTFEPLTLQRWAQTLLATEMFYGPVLALVKTSILCLFLRLFAIRRWFRYTCYGMIAFIWAWAIAEVLVGIFQCWPIAYQWDKSLPGTCIDQLAWYKWVSVPNSAHDAVLLLLPIPAVWKLQMTFQKRLALVSVFLVGGVSCIAAFVRLGVFFETTVDTYVSARLIAWTVVEPGVGFICACMPAIWPLLARLQKVAFESRHEDSRRSCRSAALEDRLESGPDVPLKSTRNGATITIAPYKRIDEDGLPLNGIRVQKDVTWTFTAEERAQGTAFG